MPGATNCWKSTSLQMKMSVYDEEECFILFCFHSFDLLLNTDFFSCITAIIFMNTIKVRLYFAAVRNVLNCLIIEECFFVIPLKKKKIVFFSFFFIQCLYRLWRGHELVFTACRNFAVNKKKKRKIEFIFQD